MLNTSKFLFASTTPLGFTKFWSVSCHWRLSIPHDNIKKTKGFLMFSGGIGRDQRHEMGQYFHSFQISDSFPTNQTKISFLNLTGAVDRKCSIKKVFLEISQKSQEKNCARVSFFHKMIKWFRAFAISYFPYFSLLNL